MAPATQPALIFTQLTQGPVAALLGYADKVRPLGGNELANEISRLGEPGDLAGPLLFLASKASDFYTGHILYADGGYTAG